MSRTMNVGKRVDTLLDKATRHHNIAMRSQLRYAARPESVTGKLDLQRMRKHEEKLNMAIADLRKLLDSRF